MKSLNDDEDLESPLRSDGMKSISNYQEHMKDELINQDDEIEDPHSLIEDCRDPIKFFVD